jgi:hypothetical protein
MSGKGDHDDARHAHVRADLARDRQAVLAGQLYVHQDDVGQFARHLGQALGAAGCLANAEAFFLQEELGQPEIYRVIFDDQNPAGGHVLSSFASERCPDP